MRRPRARRLGVFGGTFDPPHVGHLALAECARDTLGLDGVLFVPARVPPHKLGRRVTPAAERLALLRAALRGTGFDVSRVELDRPGPSYTVDTLAALARNHPGAVLHLIVGADSLRDLPTWHDPEGILARAILAVAVRPGVPLRTVPKRLGARVVVLPNPPLDLSSSDLRARVRAGRSIRFLVPDAVARRIKARGLYRA